MYGVLLQHRYMSTGASTSKGGQSIIDQIPEPPKDESKLPYRRIRPITKAGQRESPGLMSRIRYAASKFPPFLYFRRLYYRRPLLVGYMFGGLCLFTMTAPMWYNQFKYMMLPKEKRVAVAAARRMLVRERATTGRGMYFPFVGEVNINMGGGPTLSAEMYEAQNLEPPPSALIERDERLRAQAVNKTIR